LVMTSPNMSYVPEYPIERQVIETFADGRWGIREYSRWPQALVPDMWHVPCIPREPGMFASEVLFKDLHPSSSWAEDIDTGVAGLGFIAAETRRALGVASWWATSQYNSIRPSGGSYCAHGDVLVMIVQQAVERMNKLPSPPGIAVAVAAHVQRLCLELAGLLMYFVHVEPRLNSTGDYSSEVLPVLGAFVNKGTAAQTCTRIGLPTWFLQPLTNKLEVWRVVETRKVPDGLSDARSQPPIFQQTQAIAGVTNLTGNWLRTMAISVSKLACGSRIPPLAPPDDSEEFSSGEEPPAKLARMHDLGVQAKHLHMRVASWHPSSHSSSNGVAPDTRSAPQPSKSHAVSAFYSVPDTWARALEAASPVPISPASALYFYPPPFLLDTVAARSDVKIARYLHNLVRIRWFCRARLFDPSMSSQPLKIGEWRVALSGDYHTETPMPYPKRMTQADARRAGRRMDNRKVIARLFGRTAMLASYREDISPNFRGRPVSRNDIRTRHDLRLLLLWESHEINFRAELMALDTLLVQRSDWLELQRWERESAVSAVWGRPGSAVSILPLDDGSDAEDRWCSATSADRSRVRDSVVNLVKLMRWWPNFPDSLLAVVDAPKPWNATQCAQLSHAAADFYVKTFVRMYHRLPIPPIDVQGC
ncbi:hypothetical protein C8Q79DRAFT_904716, partial [Trametes meyenii]